MSMKLGYDLTIEQQQKLVMTPELIQAIQILQFNTQELDSYVEEQLLVNPVLEQIQPEHNDGDKEDGQNEASEYTAKEHEERADRLERQESPKPKDEDFDWKEYVKDRQ